MCLKKKLRNLGVLFLSFVLILGLAACGSAAKQTGTTQGASSEQQNTETSAKPAAGKTLIVYSGAGLKKPMEKIKAAFEEKYGATIQYIYGGSAQLLSQIELSGKGDVFITGSLDSYNTANKKGFVNANKNIALHIPVIGVPKGNPAGIKSLEDLAKPGVKVVLGDEKANAIGSAAQKIIAKTGLTGINNNVVSKGATVNEVVLALTTGNADAAIVTTDSVTGNKDIETIAIPEKDNYIETIPICSLKISKQTDLANQFVDFVASDEGKAIFKSCGFEPVK